MNKITQTRSIKNLGIALGVLTLGLFQTTASAVILYPVNNGFEDPDIGANASVSTVFSFPADSGNQITGWASYNVNNSHVSNNATTGDQGGFGVTYATNLNNSNNATSTTGQAVQLYGFEGGGIGQNIGGFLVGQARVSLDMQAWKGAGVTPFKLNVYFDSVIVGTFTTTNQGTFDSFQTGLFNVTTAGSHALFLQGVDTIGFVDNIRIESIPEPTTIALLGLGLLGVLTSSRRRR